MRKAILELQTLKEKNMKNQRNRQILEIYRKKNKKKLAE